MTLCFTCIYSTALASGQFPVTVMTSHAHPPMRWPHAAVTTTNKTSVSSLEAVADQHRAVSTSDLQSSTTACIDQWRVRCGDAFGQLPCRVAQDGQNHLKSRLWHSCVQRILLYTIQTTIRVSKALETLQVQHWEGPPHGLSLNARQSCHEVSAASLWFHEHQSPETSSFTSPLLRELGCTECQEQQLKYWDNESLIIDWSIITLTHRLLNKKRIKLNCSFFYIYTICLLVQRSTSIKKAVMELWWRRWPLTSLSQSLPAPHVHSSASLFSH